MDRDDDEEEDQEGGYNSDPELMNAKRSYKFNDSANRKREGDYLSRNQRPKSAKSY